MKKRSVAVLAVFAIAFSISIMYTHGYDNKFLPNMSVAGVDISGVSVPVAQYRLLEKGDTALDDTVSVAVNGTAYELSYRTLGAEVDVYRTLEKAYEYGHSGQILNDFSDRLTAAFTSVDIEPVFYAENERVAAVISAKTGVHGVSTRQILNYARSENNSSDALASVVNAQVLQKKVLTLGQAADDAMSDSDKSQADVKKIKLVLDSSLVPYQTWDIYFDSPAWFDVAVLKSGKTQTRISEKKINEFLRKHIASKIESTPSHAVIKDAPEGDVVRVTVEGRVESGVQLPLAANAKRIAAFAQQNVPEINLSVMEIPGQVINQTGRDLGELSLLGVGRSDFETSPEGRDFNVRKGINEKVNALLIAPGATYSFNKALGGPITNAGGWKDSLAIFGGTSLRPVPGGGLCQVSTTVYRAALKSGLNITRRYPHSLYVHYYAQYGEGLDSTIYPGQAGGKDLQFQNDTPSYILILAETEGTMATVAMYGTDDGRVVSFSGPFRSNEVPPELSTRQYSSKTIVWFQNILRPDGTVEKNEITSTYVKPMPSKSGSYYREISKEKAGDV